MSSQEAPIDPGDPAKDEDREEDEDADKDEDREAGARLLVGLGLNHLVSLPAMRTTMQ